MSVTGDYSINNNNEASENNINKTYTHKAYNKRLSYRRETRATRSISWNTGPTVVRIKTDRVSARGALSATATFYSATCIVLYTHHCTRHNYRTASMQCRACHQQTSVQLIMSTGPYRWSTNVDYHQRCWWHHVLLRQCTIVDADHIGGWTQIFRSESPGFQTAKVTLKVILKVTGNGWCHSIGDIRFPISLPLQLCLYIAPLPRYQHLFPEFR